MKPEAGGSVAQEVPRPDRRVRLEHQRLAESVALLDRPERVTVEIRGPRARRMLDGLLTNELPAAGDPRAVYTFLLNPKGRPVAEARAIPRGSDQVFWLDLPAVCRQPLLDHLGRTLPPIYARFAVLPDIARLAMVGPRADEAMEGWAEGPGEAAKELRPMALWEPDGSGPSDADVVVLVRREAVEGPGFDLYVSASRFESVRADLLAAVERSGGGRAGPEAYAIWRVERGIPVFGADIGPDNLPQETGQQDRAISFTKGCYTGQEVVARIHYRGHVNRHLRGLRATDDEPLAVGAPLYGEGRAVGSPTSAVGSPRFGPIGLGYVRREVEIGRLLAREADGPETVEVIALPFTQT